MSDHVNLPKNNRGRDFIIGDLHGMYGALIERMEQVSFDRKRDRIISVGDLIDRGPDNEDCIDLLEEPWFYSVMGNHEQMAYKGLVEGDHSYYMMWVRNGGDWIFNHPFPDHIKEKLKKLNELPLTITIETDIGVVGISHAAPPPSLDWAVRYVCGKEHLLWDRDMFLYGEPSGMIDNANYTFHGHTPRPEIQFKNNSFWIDTGSCWKVSGELSFVQVHPILDLKPWRKNE